MYGSQGTNIFAGGAEWIDFNPISAFIAMKRGWVNMYASEQGNLTLSVLFCLNLY